MRRIRRTEGRTVSQSQQGSFGAGLYTACVGMLEKDATKKAGEIAGLTVIGIVPEPVAAALHYGVTGSADGTTFLVYDLGGGTFDISLIRMTEDSIEVLAVGGDHMLGGAHSGQNMFEHT